MMVIKITGESVKFIGSKYIQESLMNMSLFIHESTYSHTSYKHFTSFTTISQHLEFKVKIQNNPNKHITTTTESSVP